MPNTDDCAMADAVTPESSPAVEEMLSSDQSNIDRQAVEAEFGEGSEN